MDRNRGVRVFALVGVLALFAAACGDDSGGSSGDDGGAQSERDCQPEPAGQPVKLMVIFEGSAGVAQPEQSKGALAAAQGINCRGGIDGRPVEVIECDTGNDPNTAAECGRQAVDEQVVALVGNFSIHSGEFLPLMAENQIPSIGLNPATAADFTSEASFPITGGAVSTFGTLPVALADQGYENIALARIDLAEAAALSSFSNSALETVGLQLVRDVPVPEGAPDMASFVAAATKGDVDAVVVGMAAQDATNFVITARQNNPDVALAVIATEQGAVIDALGDAANGLITSGTLYPIGTDTEAVKTLAEDMEAAGYDPANSLSYASTIVVQMLADQIDGELTHTSLWQKLPTVTDLDTGLLPPIQFAEGGQGGGIPRIFNPCEIAFELTVSGDTFESAPVWDSFRNPYTGEDCPTAPLPQSFTSEEDS